MGVFTERISALLFVLPRRTKGASEGVRTRVGPDDRGTSTPTFMTGREYSPSQSVQRADFEALRAFSRVR
jgi:hypothetical protein